MLGQSVAYSAGFGVGIGLLHLGWRPATIESGLLGSIGRLEVEFLNAASCGLREPPREPMGALSSRVGRTAWVRGGEIGGPRSGGAAAADNSPLARWWTPAAERAGWRGTAASCGFLWEAAALLRLADPTRRHPRPGRRAPRSPPSTPAAATRRGGATGAGSRVRREAPPAIGPRRRQLLGEQRQVVLHQQAGQAAGGEHGEWRGHERMEGSDLRSVIGASFSQSRSTPSRHAPTLQEQRS